MEQKILHKLVLFQMTMMYALHKLVEGQGEVHSIREEVLASLSRRMKEGHELLLEINNDLQKEHDDIMVQLSMMLRNVPKQ